MRYIINFAFFLCLAAPGFGQASSVMNNSPTAPDTPDQWGGTGVLMTVSKNWVNIEFNGASATVRSGLKADRDGKFSVKGVYSPSPPGAVRLGSRVSEPSEVRITGKIIGKKMSFRMTKSRTGQSMGKYDLELGRQATILRIQ